MQPLKNSPWGSVQRYKRIADGIFSVSTASHGGFRLSPQRQAAMPPALALAGGWYEEDLEYNRVILAFPDAFKPDQVESAHRTMKHWHPDAYAGWSGSPVAVGDSHVLQERQFKAEHANDFIVTAAWGDWHASVPKDTVAVCAARGGRRGAEEKFFLVPKVEYQDRDGPGFVVDTARHKEIPPLR